MRNTPAHSSSHPPVRHLTAGELVSNLKKTLINKEDGTFPLCTDVQNALHVLISQMRAVDPTSAIFIQSALSRYNGDTFLDLPWYIQYIENEIISPLEQPLNNRSAAIISTITRYYQIMSLRETILKSNNSLIALNSLKQVIEQFLNKAKTLEEIDFLRGRQAEVQNIIDLTLTCLDNSRTLCSKLTDTIIIVIQ